MSRYHRIFIVVVLLLAVGVLACTLGGAGKPTVEIVSPPSGSQVQLGEQI